MAALRPSSSSSLLEVLQEHGSRPRSASKGSKDPSLHPLSKRTSFIDFDGNSLKRRELSDNGIFSSIKGRLGRKRSAPLLSSVLFTPTLPRMDSPTTPTGPEATHQSLTWSTCDLARDETVTNSGATLSARSYREERKHTVVPGEIIEGVGYGYRQSQSSRDYDLDVNGVDVSKGHYRPLPFSKKDRSLLHSYPCDEAAYMLSYNKVVLQNEHYFNLLLRRLNPSEAPSFHKYSTPPQSVLDLGCGQGTWVQEAASAWADAGTKIVGFDLVDLVGETAKSLPNVTWSRGNFVAYQLPFKSGTFDLVRLANLTEAVPRHRWEHVLMEAKRVLKSHGKGRIEIIDDEVIFSYPDQIASSSCSTSSSRSRTARSSWSGSEVTKFTSDTSLGGNHLQETTSSFLDLDADARSIDSTPGLIHDDSPSEGSCECLPTPVECTDDLATLIGSERIHTTQAAQMPSTTLCQEIEKIYETMLEGAFSVEPRPASFLEGLLRKVFGPTGRTKAIKDFQLSLLNPVMHNMVVSTKAMKTNQLSPRRAKKLFRVDRGSRRVEKEKEIMDKLVMSQAQMRGSKALKVLGTNGPPLSHSAALSDPISTRLSDDSDIFGEPGRPKMRSRTSSSASLTPNHLMHPPGSPVTRVDTQDRYRPTGLFLFPNQFLETTPVELEMYVCKHTNTLLGSKVALDEHVLGLRDESGEPLVSEEEWHEMLWEYERSRRQRFNLPGTGGLFDDSDDEDEDSTDPLKERIKHSRTIIPPVAVAINNQSHPQRLSSGSPDSGNSCTQVRRIRVFEAYKT
ncbi:hypothetical protein M0805_000935 [Coniferiporia weirii]|nr:hypothetical protein M0805_000935 [Coniferiporia weirii]